MKLLNLFLLAQVLALAVPSNQTLHVELQKSTTDAVAKRSILQLTLRNQQIMYTAALKLGSQQSEINFILDTGSSDMWVSSTAFSGSTTMQKSSEAFSVTYGNGNSASGVFVTDNIVVGSATIRGAKFGYVDDNVDGRYYLGIGLPAAEVDATVVGNDRRGNYNNFPQLLKQQGLISSASYSLWLNTIDCWTGSILFGGVDHAKYSGTLTKVPIIRTRYNYVLLDKPVRLSVKLNGISATNSAGKSGKIISGADIPVLLDSGTTYTFLPNAWVTAIAASFKATANATYGGYNLPKGGSPMKPQGSINFDFSGVEIKTPFESFIRQAIDASGNKGYHDAAHQWPIWQLGIYPGNSVHAGDGVDMSGESVYILGDTFLAGAYVVYDLDNLEVGIAPANTGIMHSSNVEAISQGIPSATNAPSYYSTSTGMGYTASTLTII